MEHPLNSHGPFPSPPGSPPPGSPSDKIDLERNELGLLTIPTSGYTEGFLLSALSSNTNTDKDPLLLKNSIQSEQHISELRRRRSGRRQSNYYSNHRVCYLFFLLTIFIFYFLNSWFILYCSKCTD